MNRFVGGLLGLSVACSLLAHATAGDWPGWRGADRTARSDETGLIENWNDSEPELVWMAAGMGRGYAGVSVQGDRIYTTGNRPEGQAVIAVDAKDGSVVWATPLTPSPPKHGYQGSRCTPTIDGDRLYAISSDGAIACLKADSGAIVWQKDFEKQWNGRMMSGWGFAESPLVDGDRVVCTPGGRDAMMVALDKLIGDEIWRCAVPPLGDAGKDGAAYSSIVISNACGVKQYVQLIGRGVIGVRAGDGKFLWGYNRIANKTANIPTPIVNGDYVFCSTGYGGGAALLKLQAEGDHIDAEEQYFLNARTLENHHGGMVLVDGKIYCGHKHNNGLPICVDMVSGDVIWGGDQRGPGRGSAAVLYADGNLIFRYQSGEVALIEATPAEYRLKGVFQPAYQEDRSWAHPVVADGRLYLREQDKLMCYDISEP